MGIPFYFKNIVTRFPNIIRKPSKRCSHLYLDFNCIVHQCAASTVQIGSLDAFHDLVIEESVKYIDKICATCAPHELLYIAVDGVCPRAKMSQQRKRRYMSCWQKSELTKERERLGLNDAATGSGDDAKWDSNIVTPGTEFMKRLDARLQSYFLVGKKKTKVICSGSSELGEGEHKIIRHIRDNKLDKKDIVIYGLDADLILLSLLLCSEADTEGNTIRLLRERPEFRLRLTGASEFCMLDINELESAIDMACCPSVACKKEKVRDIVMLTSLVGNDFLPSLSYLKIKDGGLDTLIQAYDETVAAMGGTARLVMGKSSVNWMFFDLLFKHLAKTEDVNFKAANDNYYAKRPYSSPPSRSIDDPLSGKKYQLDNFAALNKTFEGKIDSTKLGWHRDYYSNLFGSASAEVVESACRKYTDGLEWNFEYYLDGRVAPSSRWYYPHIYSPTIKDMSNYITMRACTNGDYKTSAFDKGNYTPALQLMMVLPPDSIRKFVPQYSRLLSDPALGCMDMYPTEFKIMTYLKSQSWECAPLLPPIEDERIASAIQTL